MEGVIIMYAICFELMTDEINNRYGALSNNAYTDIKKTLEMHGFTHQQGSMYFGDTEEVNAVSCILAVHDLVQKFDWFASNVRNIRMLRIAESSDLMPALKALPKKMKA